MSRHMMRYNGKEYERKEVHVLSSWQYTCAGCAFDSDQTECANSYQQHKPETYCQTKSKSFIFKECQKDDTEGVNDD